MCLPCKSSFLFYTHVTQNRTLNVFYVHTKRNIRKKGYILRRQYEFSGEIDRPQFNRTNRQPFRVQHQTLNMEDYMLVEATGVLILSGRI